MHEMLIYMDTIEKVKRFVDIVSTYREDIDLVKGSYSVDAKSIMGIFSMNLTEPLMLKVSTTDKRFKEISYDLREYVA